jgi:hypothetical protein
LLLRQSNGFRGGGGERDGLVKTRRLRNLLIAAAAAGTLILGACSGGGSSSGGGGVPPPPGPTPTATPVPTPSPKPTPTPTPCPTAAGNPATEPVLLGCPSTFPTVSLPGGGSAGGSITFQSPNPSSGVTITLGTGATAPPGYPPSIPPGFAGAGALAIAPWLTYSLNAQLSAQSISLNIFTGPLPQGITYFGVYDLTRSRTTPDGTSCALISPSLSPRGRMRTGDLTLRQSGRRGGRVHPDVTIPPFDQNYIGLFFIQQVGPSDSNDPINPSGSDFTIPSLGPPSTGFSGTINYPANNAPSGTLMSLESINVNNISFSTICAAPTPPFGTPILYIGMQTPASPLVFQNGTATTTVQSSTLVNGAFYSLFAYDVQPGGNAPQIGQTQTKAAQSGAVTFLSPLNGFNFQNTNNDVIVFEITKN